MKRLKSIFIYTVLFFGFLIFFAPKTYFYYLLESELDKKNVKISQERVFDKGFCLKTEEGRVYYDDLEVGKFETFSVLPALLFNKINVKNFTLSDDMSRFLKGNIESIDLTYHVVTPMTLHLSVTADTGDMYGTINIKDRNISLNISPSPSLLKEAPFWLKKLKKSAEGEYLYETIY